MFRCLIDSCLQVKLGTTPVTTLSVVLVRVVSLKAEPPGHRPVGLQSTSKFRLRPERLIGGCCQNYMDSQHTHERSRAEGGFFRLDCTHEPQLLFV